MLPCVIFEDEHLLVVNKPAGWNTHAPGPGAGEGIYDWLRHREPRWAGLAIIHRLDKETSGVLLFGKTTLANRSLTRQFAERGVGKKYLLLTERRPGQREFTVKSRIARAGERYASGARGEPAETQFSIANPEADRIVLPTERENQNPRQTPERPPAGAGVLVEARPLTGRTHQIRVHAAESGFPVLGDALYGGAPFPRVCLHAASLRLRHPASGEEMTFKAPADFTADPRLGLRRHLIEARETTAFRLLHGASDGWPGWYVDRLGDFLFSQSAGALTEAQRAELARLRKWFTARGVYHKILTRQIHRTTPSDASPELAVGEPAPEPIVVRENGVQFEVRFDSGGSAGLFLDQRDNRRRFLTGHLAAGFEWPVPAARSTLLNCFAYTCGFSVCAAVAGAHTTSLDMSQKYLAWGRRNFALNRLDPAVHDFIYGDVFDWLKRLAKKQRAFDVVALDPPTFSQSKAHGVFRAEKDFGRLVGAALPVLAPGGVLFAATNAAGWAPEKFLDAIETAIHAGKRKILQQHYFPQPPDFPVSRAEPAYLKTIWLRIA